MLNIEYICRSVEYEPFSTNYSQLALFSTCSARELHNEQNFGRNRFYEKYFCKVHNVYTVYIMSKIFGPILHMKSFFAKCARCAVHRLWIRSEHTFWQYLLPKLMEECEQIKGNPKNQPPENIALNNKSLWKLQRVIQKSQRVTQSIFRFFVSHSSLFEIFQHLWVLLKSCFRVLPSSHVWLMQHDLLEKKGGMGGMRKASEEEGRWRQARFELLWRTAVAGKEAGVHRTTEDRVSCERLEACYSLGDPVKL